MISSDEYNIAKGMILSFLQERGIAGASQVDIRKCLELAHFPITHHEVYAVIRRMRDENLIKWEDQRWRTTDFIICPCCKGEGYVHASFKDPNH